MRKETIRAAAGAMLTVASAGAVSLPATAAAPPEVIAAEHAGAWFDAGLTPRPPNSDCRPGRGIRDEICRRSGSTGPTAHPNQRALAERAVQQQQRELNRLFDPYSIGELEIDGDSGPVTRQRLCAFRLAMGLEPTTDDMEPGGDEEALLTATEALPIPAGVATEPERWILIDQTCQVMFVGAGPDHLQFVFPTSTGLAEFPTRLQDRTRAYRFNPANHNNGWHNSTTYPAANDNPLNGNMYRPLYFDGGQAIHGANSVPRSPASHGCARLRTWHQDELLEWLGLAGSGATSSRSRINVNVTVQGSWQG